ncbi:uncharacterized protein PV09_01387 [Verruconis gallopava]|uniref:CSC1/OSCA1-like 7TM region domain-containing protein n=1 Tax=Verruconis gallopava TaxID=253628 RepID=A0A0D1Z6C4_9PEZI|nr:uncharacterized protein PV09_01387 [Verruconis gallopava]KIW08492.1 hypothetical protein PV09_01387 [Verruconis gallopava]
MEPSPVLVLLRRDDDASAPAATKSAADQFLELISNPFANQIRDNAIWASLATSLALTAIIALIFCFLRPLNTTVYAPRLKHADEKHAPPRIGKSPWAWINPVLQTREQMLVEKVGLDAAIFIRFTKMCRNIFLALSVLGLAVLIPVNVVGGNLQFGKDAKTSVVGIFTKMTPQYMIGEIFWAFVAAAYVIDFVCCFFLWSNYRAVTRLRREYFESPEYQNSLHARTLMITEIPKTLRTDEGVLRIVDEVKTTQDLPRGTIARNVRDLPELIEEHEELVQQLEKILAKYLKNPNKLPANRPLTTPSKKDPNYVKGQKVDAIIYLTSRIDELEGKINNIRLSVDQRNAMPYGFASYESVEEAHSVAYAGRRKHPHGATVRLAPRPSDIIWQNLVLSRQAQRVKKWSNYLWVILLLLVWTCVNALLAVFVSNLSNLALVWKAFDTELHRDPQLWAVIQGILAPAITSAFYYCLPIIFRRLSMRGGDITKTSRERHVIHKLYAFFIFNNLIVFSLFGAIWQYVVAVINAKDNDENILDAIKHGDIWTKTFYALCSVSPFWITWLLQRNLGAAIDLAQIVNLGWGSFARRFLSPTPRQLIQYTAPQPFDYASYYNYFLFYATVALCFAAFQPLVLPITALYFVLDSWLKKYLILYVFVTKNESGGQFWRVLFNRFLFAVFLSNLIVAFLVVAKAFDYWTMLGAMIPLPLMLIGFKLYCMKTFDDQIHFYTRGFMNKEAGVVSDTTSRRSNNVAVRFGHPALYKSLMTPMVHAKSQHLLAQVYKGRLGEDDAVSMAGFSDMYNMKDLKKGGQGKKGPFEFVNDSQLDFENYKDRDDFRSEYGGDGELYGKPEDIIRTATPATIREANAARIGSGNHKRSSSRDSESTVGGQDIGTTYPAGYHTTPSALREASPSPDRGAWDRSYSPARSNLVQGAAPMGSNSFRNFSGGSRPQSPALSVLSQQTPMDNEATSYDYFRGRR